jgi:hypothetical protein
MNDGPFVDEAGKNARRIFYPSLTNSGNLQKRYYSDGYYTYIFGYIESLILRTHLFIIGTKLSIPSQLQKLLVTMSKMTAKYNFGFRKLIQPIGWTTPSPLRGAGCEGQALL